MPATLTQETANWWARSRGTTTATWVSTYQQSLNARHRDQIVGLVKELGVTSLLEVGSHCGPNLVRMAQECPAITSLSGVDVNPDAIAAGQHWIESLHLQDRIELAVGRAPEATAHIADGAVEAVLTCYALAYIDPRDLDAMLYEVGRLASKAILLAEPQAPEKSIALNQTLSGYHEWAHSYESAARWIATWRGRTVRVVPVSPPVDRLNGIVVATRA